MTDHVATRRLKGRSYAETRSAVLDLIRSGDGISRVDLSRRSGLTEATISKIVKELLAEGVVITVGLAESTGGKRATLLALNTSVLYALGVTLDVSTIVLVLCGLNGAAIRRLSLPGLGSDEPADVIERTANAINALLDDQGIGREAIVGIGLASGGRRGGPGGWSIEANLADRWDRVDVGEAVRAKTGLPVVVENDANCAALGTFWSGGASSPRTFLTIYMAHGIGAGIVIGGSVYRGTGGNAGEIGHIVVQPDGPLCWCGAHGCLETVAAPRGIVRRVLADEDLRAALDLAPETDGGQVYRRVLQAYTEGDPEIARIIETSARWLAQTVLGLANTLDLDWIQLAGPGFAGTAEVYLEAVRRILGEASLARGLHPVAVALGGLEPEVAALGAASVVLHGNLTPHHDLVADY